MSSRANAEAHARREKEKKTKSTPYKLPTVSATHTLQGFENVAMNSAARALVVSTFHEAFKVNLGCFGIAAARETLQSAMSILYLCIKYEMLDHEKCPLPLWTSWKKLAEMFQRLQRDRHALYDILPKKKSEGWKTRAQMSEFNDRCVHMFRVHMTPPIIQQVEKVVLHWAHTSEAFTSHCKLRVWVANNCADALHVELPFARYALSPSFHGEGTRHVMQSMPFTLYRESTDKEEGVRHDDSTTTEHQNEGDPRLSKHVVHIVSMASIMWAPSNQHDGSASYHTIYVSRLRRGLTSFKLSWKLWVMAAWMVRLGGNSSRAYELQQSIRTILGCGTFREEDADDSLHRFWMEATAPGRSTLDRVLTVEHVAKCWKKDFVVFDVEYHPMYSREYEKSIRVIKNIQHAIKQTSKWLGHFRFAPKRELQNMFLLFARENTSDPAWMIGMYKDPFHVSIMDPRDY